MNFVKLLKGIGADAEPRRVGTDAMSPLFAQLLPMAFADAEIVDGGPALRSARRIKTTEEVDAIRAAIEVAEAALAAAVAELRPGRERARADRACSWTPWRRAGVTTPATQDVVRVTSAGGDRDATGDRRIQAGDLVAFDAGVVADGYAGEVGRTWPADLDGTRRASGTCTGAPTSCGTRLLDACRPGAPASRAARRLPRGRRAAAGGADGAGPGPRLRRPGDRARPARDRGGETARPGRRAGGHRMRRRRRRRFAHHARARPHHRRRARGADIEPVLDRRDAGGA